MSDKQEEIFESEPEVTTRGENVSLQQGRVEIENEDIVRTSVDVSDAFEVFSGKLYDNTDSVVHNRADYSLVDANEKKSESPLQRYARLKGEIDMLQSDLDTVLQDEEQGILTSQKDIWKVLRKETDNMKGKLLGLEKHKYLHPPPKQSENDTLYTTLQSAIVDIDDYTKATQPNTLSSSSGVNGLTWNELEVLESIQLLEKRITKLEQVIGTVTNSVDVSSSLVFPISDTVSKLERRIDLLDDECLEKIHAKYNLLQTELDVLNRDKAKSTELVQAAERINGLKSKMDSVASVANCLPDVVLRFKSLEGIHQATVESAQRLCAAEENVVRIKETSASNKELLEILTTGLKENILIMKDNMQAIDKRIAKATGE